MKTRWDRVATSATSRNSETDAFELLKTMVARENKREDKRDQPEMEKGVRKREREGEEDG